MRNGGHVGAGVWIVLAAAAIGGEKVLLRQAVMRNGPGAYYEAVVTVPENSRVNVGESRQDWVQGAYKADQGWLPGKAFEKPKAGLDYGALLAGEQGVVVSSVDIAAATKGIVATTFQDKYNVSFAVADQLDRIRIDTVLVEAILSDVRAGTRDGLVGRLPRQSYKNNVILRPDAEMLLGRTLVANVATNGLSDNAERMAYVNAVAAVVGAKTDRYDLAYRVGIMKETDLNGFGLPAGYVLVSEGLLAQVRDEAELACLLGHEMAHASLYHGLREFTKRSKQRRADTVFDELDELSGGGTDEAIAQDLDRLAKTSYLKVIGGRAREDEMEADLFGIAYAASAGYDPNAMVAFLQRVAEQGTARDAFRHHPTVQDRIQAIEAAIRQYDMAGGGQHGADRFKGRMVPAGAAR